MPDLVEIIHADEAGDEVTVVQVHPDAASMLKQVFGHPTRSHRGDGFTPRAAQP